VKTLREYIRSNKSFYKKKAFQDDKKIILFLVSKDIYFSSLTMKFSKALSDEAGKDLVVVPNLNLPRKTKKLISSFFPSKILNFKFLLVKSFIKNFTTILKINNNLSNGEDLLNLKIKKMNIGKHLYDYLLAKFNLVTLEKLNLNHRVSIFLDLLYFFSCIKLLSVYKDPILILPDNVYRHGAIFEYAKKNRIECFAGLSMTEFTIHRYDDEKSYEDHCRTPSNELVENLVNNPQILKEAKKYLSERISGFGFQHDTVRAFSTNKKELSKDELIDTLNLNFDKPIVLVAAHIFKDAPHGLPNLLFNDFSVWLKQTCKELIKNTKINFIVKEHPTSELYNESGQISKILEEINMREKLLSNDVKTSSLFNSVDYIVTCGGTAAMEFAYYGVPSLLASKPPYSDFGFTINSKTVNEYFEKIKNIHRFKKLSLDKRNRALILLYLFSELQKSDHLEKIIGTQKIYMGIKPDINKFLIEMIEDNFTELGHEALKKNLKFYLNQEERNLMNNNLIQTMQIKKV